MLALSKNCLTSDQLQRFLHGNLSADDFESASDHLDQCRECQSSFERIGGETNASDPLSPSWFAPAGPDPQLADPQHVDPQQAEIACQFALHRLITSPRLSTASENKAGEPKHLELGPYRILSDLGHGGMGTVCLAEHQRLKRRCAIKLLPPARVTQPGWLERFEREMAAVASLEHPGIVRANDAGCHEGWHYLVMEYLDGLDVGYVVDRLGPLPVADACEIVRQASLAIAHVHTAGLVHRDIKPSNLMLNRAGIIKLLDLGLVLAGDDPLASDDRLTTVGHLMGTLPAMSPEQLIDSRHVDASSDVYSLGATLYRLIAGQWPFDSSGGIARRILRMTNESPPSLTSVRPQTDMKIVSLVEQMLARDPNQRPTAEEVAVRLTDWTANADLRALLTQAELVGESTPAATAPSRPSLPKEAALQASRGLVPPSTLPRRIHAGHYAAGLLAVAAVLGVIVIKIKTDKGEVIIETNGSDVQVAVAPDEPNANIPLSTSDQTPAPAQRLYQGKDLQHWLDTLEREQDIETVGQAMKAIELLSRDTERRSEAAQKSLMLAREHGSILYDEVNRSEGSFGFGSSSSDPSRRYMGHLRIVFHAYFPQPAIDAIDSELVNGNVKSKIAAVVLLDEYVSGVYDGTEYHERRATAHAAIKELAASDSGMDQAKRLMASLGTTIESLRDSPDPLASPMRLTTWSLAEKLVEAADGRLRGSAGWMSDFVISETQRSIAEYQVWVEKQAVIANQPPIDAPPTTGDNRSFGDNGVLFQQPPAWLLYGSLFAEAMILHDRDKLSMPSDFAVAVISHPQFSWHPHEQMDKAFEILSTMSPDAEAKLVTAIETALDKYFGSLQEANASPSPFKASPSPFNDSLHLARTQFSAITGFWSKAIPFYARHAPNVEQANDRLERLIESLRAHGLSFNSTQVLAAQKVLTQRLKESSQSETTP